MYPLKVSGRQTDRDGEGGGGGGGGGEERESLAAGVCAEKE